MGVISQSFSLYIYPLSNKISSICSVLVSEFSTDTFLTIPSISSSSCLSSLNISNFPQQDQKFVLTKVSRPSCCPPGRWVGVVAR